MHFRSPDKYRSNDVFALSMIEVLSENPYIVARGAGWVDVLIKSMVMAKFKCSLDMKDLCCGWAHEGLWESPGGDMGEWQSSGFGKRLWLNSNVKLR